MLPLREILLRRESKSIILLSLIIYRLCRSTRIRYRLIRKDEGDKGGPRTLRDIGFRISEFRIRNVEKPVYFPLSRDSAKDPLTKMKTKICVSLSFRFMRNPPFIIVLHMYLVFFHVILSNEYI